MGLPPSPPTGGLDLITAVDSSYPAAHMTGVVALAIGVGATFAVTRQSLRRRVIWFLGSAVVVVALGVDRWLTGAHYISDIVGGALLGAFVATAALLAAGVRVMVPYELGHRDRPDRAAAAAGRGSEATGRGDLQPRQGARRHSPSAARRVRADLARLGSRDLAGNHVDDPGRRDTGPPWNGGRSGAGCRRRRTIRVICSGLADTGIPFGLIPAGHRQPAGAQCRHPAG